MGSTDFADCQTIIMAFERGCAYSTDERSVFAMMTSQLEDAHMMAEVTRGLTRTLKGSRIRNIDKEIAADLEDIRQDALADSDAAWRDLNEATGEFSPTVEPPLPDTMDGNPFLDAGASIDSIATNPKVVEWFKDCIPCEFNLMFEDLANFNMQDKLADLLSGMEEYWKQLMKRLKDFADMFRDIGDYVDICAFLKWVRDFVCLPDLKKIIAALIALLVDLMGFLDGFGIDLVLGLITPLFMPILTKFVDLLTRFITMVIEPIQCIIRSISNMMRSLDIAGGLKFPKSLKIRGPKPLQVIGGKEYWHNDSSREPLSTTQIFNKETDTKGNLGTSFNPFGQKDYATDPGVEKVVDTSKISDGLNLVAKKTGQMKKAAKAFENILPSLLANLSNLLRRSVTRFQNLLQAYLDDLLRLIQEYILGASFHYGTGQKQKLAILQLIKLIEGIVKLFTQAPNCDLEDSASLILQDSARSGGVHGNSAAGFTMYKDEEGNIRVEENDDGAADRAKDLLSSALDPESDWIQAIQDGRNDSIIDTGDDVINSDITDIVAKITTPVNVVYGCPDNITTVDIGQINEWIKSGT